MWRQHVNVAGPIRVTAADGYRLETRDVLVDLNQRTLQSHGRVDGRMPLGSFSGDRLRADLNSRTVVLDGRARLRIVQGGLR
jgi:lipopolysaccharide export system protein LptC